MEEKKPASKPVSIGEVAKIIGVEIHTIRFWTDEFKEYISFTIGKGERRYYDENAIACLEKIKKLLYTDGIRIKVIKEKKLLLASNIEKDTSSYQLKLDKLMILLNEAKMALEVS